MKIISFSVLIGFLLFIVLSQVPVVEARRLNKNYSRKTYRSIISGTYRIQYPAWKGR